MEAVALFGITFRSGYHLSWFLITMTLFGASVVCSVICLWQRCYSWPIEIWFFLGIMSLGTSLSAITVTHFGVINGPIWSMDCIWYNGLLAGIYFSCAGICLIYRHRRITSA